MSDSTTQTSSGGCGCLSTILTILALWALLFGVTVSGKHYEMGCSCSRGVEVSGGGASQRGAFCDGGSTPKPHRERGALARAGVGGVRETIWT